jgi:hypothetical protein
MNLRRQHLQNCELEGEIGLTLFAADVCSLVAKVGAEWSKSNWLIFKVGASSRKHS